MPASQLPQFLRPGFAREVEDIMRPSDLLVLGKGEAEEVASIIAKGDGIRIIFAGSNLPTNASADAKNLISLTTAVCSNKKGIIAVGLDRFEGYGKNSSTKTYCFFLEVNNTSGKAEVNLDDEWFPTADRLGNVSKNNFDVCIEVCINDKWYTTDGLYAPDCKYESLKKFGKIFVPDGGNLLCKYLVGDIPAQDVIDAACDAKRETDALAEAAELRKQVDFLKDELNAANELLSVVEKSRDFMRSDLSNLVEKEKSLRQSRLKMVDIIDELLKSQEWKPWGAARRREINNSIATELLV
jgi:hypothetical protein